MYKVTVEYERERNCLKIHRNGKWEGFYDYGEPEDNSFHRDYSWIKPALEEAYRAGREDGLRKKDAETGCKDKQAEEG